MKIVECRYLFDRSFEVRDVESSPSNCGELVIVEQDYAAGVDQTREIEQIDEDGIEPRVARSASR
jgi:hypothetical protein